MRSWKLMALALGFAALLFTARPAQAQVFIGPPAPVVVAPEAGWGLPPDGCDHRLAPSPSVRGWDGRAAHQRSAARGVLVARATEATEVDDQRPDTGIR